MDNFRYLQPSFSLGHHTHVLIDRLRCPQPPDGWPVVPVVSAVLEPQAHLYPWLVALAELTHPQLLELDKTLAEKATSPDMMLLGSQYELATLKLRLADAFIFQPDGGRERYLLRYYDCRVFFQLLRMQPALALQRWSRQTGIDFCSWQDEGGRVTFDCRALIAEQASIPAAQEYHRLLNIGLINQVLQRYGMPPDLAKRRTLSDETERLIITARDECGLTDPDDLISFALLGLTVHERYWQTQKMSALLKLTAGQPGAFHTELTLMDDEALAQLRHQCQSYFREEERNGV